MPKNGTAIPLQIRTVPIIVKVAGRRFAGHERKYTSLAGRTLSVTSWYVAFPVNVALT